MARFFLLVHRVAAYPNRIAATLLVGLVIAICVNALVLQQSRHPAPLFHKNLAPPVSPPQAPEKPQAAVPAAIVPAQPAGDPIGQLLQSAPAAEPETAPVQPPATKQGPEVKPVADSISQLLESNPAPAAAEQSKTVLAAQRALVKLGFVLKPDGIVGSATRQAIEKFERDHGLPVHGELTPKVMHELGARSGIAIE